MGVFDRCSICGKYAFLDHHRCNPVFTCWIPDHGGTEYNSGEEVHGFDAEEAAEEYIKEKCYSSGGDYYGQLMDGDGYLVMVRTPEGNLNKIRVTGEQSIEFHSQIEDVTEEDLKTVDQEREKELKEEEEYNKNMESEEDD